jgi:hypothetical protein
MKFRIQVVRVADDGAERMKEVMEFRTAGTRHGNAGNELRRREKPCSRECCRSLWPNHAGISATVSRPGKGPFDRSKAGCVGANQS